MRINDPHLHKALRIFHQSIRERESLQNPISTHNTRACSRERERLSSKARCCCAFQFALRGILRNRVTSARARDFHRSHSRRKDCTESKKHENNGIARTGVCLYVCTCDESKVLSRRSKRRVISLSLSLSLYASLLFANSFWQEEAVWFRERGEDADAEV